MKKHLLLVLNLTSMVMLSSCIGGKKDSSSAKEEDSSQVSNDSSSESTENSSSEASKETSSENISSSICFFFLADALADVFGCFVVVFGGCGDFSRFNF